jgi:hypothetical protein
LENPRSSHHRTRQLGNIGNRRQGQPIGRREGVKGRNSALHFMDYNYCKIHSTLRITPAMAAGLPDQVWEIEDLLKLID